MASETLRASSAVAAGGSSDGGARAAATKAAAVAAGSQHAQALAHFLERTLRALLGETSLAVELVEPAADALLALVLADEAFFSRYAAAHAWPPRSRQPSLLSPVKTVGAGNPRFGGRSCCSLSRALCCCLLGSVWI